MHGKFVEGHARRVQIRTGQGTVVCGVDQLQKRVFKLQIGKVDAFDVNKVDRLIALLDEDMTAG